MNKRKRKSGVWHHRLPDFQLVYCGPQNYVQPKAKKLEKKLVKVSVFSSDSELSDKKVEEKKKS
jgi:hypothetical protein